MEKRINKQELIERMRVWDGFNLKLYWIAFEKKAGI